ncbi:MAG: PepSY-associated TM helix domain-containing protein [Kangiellaceae bacterium]|nr:PepSY-associated TM helix domain-containing protein [Kangiellaceae bacterium]MCW8999137.1 PepSY-associated TM helix domain-containing protein [Kangiellaceae bacterium]
MVRSLHRDIGYFCIGMTIVFAVSGLAVNHIDDWNPNYEVTRQSKAISISSELKQSEQLNSILLEQLGLDLKVRAEFWESENRFKLFAEADITVEVDFKNQIAVIESISQRPILSAFNRLHLNEVNRAWVIFSDLFAILLLFLAFSSFFMLKGKNGVFSLKGLWVVAGVIVPAVFIAI